MYSLRSYYAILRSVPLLRKLINNNISRSISYIAVQNDYDYDEHNKIIPVQKLTTTLNYQNVITVTDTVKINKELHYIYLVKPKSNIFIPNNNSNIYKLGKSIINSNDLNEPKIRNKQKNELILVSKCINAPLLETKILYKFNDKFVKYKFGNKFFIGDEFKMINLINNMILKEYKANK